MPCFFTYNSSATIYRMVCQLSTTILLQYARTLVDVVETAKLFTASKPNTDRQFKTRSNSRGYKQPTFNYDSVTMEPRRYCTAHYIAQCTTPVLRALALRELSQSTVLENEESHKFTSFCHSFCQFASVCQSLHCYKTAI